MARDEALEQRIRELLAGVSDVREQRMFGGLAFLIGGHISLERWVQIGVGQAAALPPKR